MEKKEIKQKQLADGIGVTEATISRYLNNVQFPRIELICKIANYLDTSVDYLLGISTSTKTYEIETLKKILKNAGYTNNNEDLTNEELEQVIKFAVNNKEFLKIGNK